MISSKKKRKLDEPPRPPPLSAVAARRAALEAKTISLSAPPSKSEKIIPQRNSGKLGTSNLSSAKVPLEDAIPEPAIIDTVADHLITEQQLQKLEDDSSASYGSREGSHESSPSRPNVALSTFIPRRDNIKELEDGGLLIKLAPGERLVILGQYRITVRRGTITLQGAGMHSDSRSYNVYAASSHSLPVIRCLTTQTGHSQICLRPLDRGLNSLQALSPLFGKLWSEESGPLSSEYSSAIPHLNPRTYQILYSTDTSQKSYLQPLASPPEWNATLSKLSDFRDGETPIIMICGPKSSGKSTFARLFTNRLLSNDDMRGVALLDLDPGQPEYSTPGHLSLVRVDLPNFGPPYTHPTPGTYGRMIRSHSIAAVSPAMDPTLYMACALDLFAHYRSEDAVSQAPLIINTPGWVLGTGLELLVELISKVRPNSVVYMSEGGPREVTESLQQAAKSTPLLTLPSQASEYGTRTPAHLRTMQYMSYFHGRPGPYLTANESSWTNIPLTSIRPWEIRYSGESSGILGILCYGEQPSENVLAETINGTLVSIVIVHDMAAIPGWSTSIPVKTSRNHLSSKKNDESYISFNDDTDIGNIDADDLHPSTLTTPLIVKTPEHLPYFNPLNAISLDPKFSHSIGLGLVRGIDVPRRRLQVLTPISPNVIEEINAAGKKIVLISGKLDTPGFAYTEEINLRESSQKEGRKCGARDDNQKDKGGDNDAFSSAPWIETLEGSQGRGVGARVWRVRRDLGRTTD
ncbi:hypothetical protein BJ875DRAFT_480926 [Amylocarpus encephaloides]|uniref:Polynucleotide 5'-hydroxyl-kinase GRC3 n=1 Tax=Amylocarpus encephaloides TaxID=45428 RepID=A0A9P8C8I3_9HELO|nr:hypothetical protein BJ875DRAFT_480926 [Amylocarpus encephaloides]